MSANPSSSRNKNGMARRAALLAGLLAVSLVASALLVPRAAAMGQSSLGFAEASAGEGFQVLGPGWTVRTSLTFLRTETVRVNVTSTLVDYAAGGAGRTETLTLQRFDGVPVTTATFTESAGGPPFVYTASIDFSGLGLEPDYYYLHVLIDDTSNTFEATSAILVGAPVAPHIIETYADNRFSTPSDVFTPTSTMWVKVLGLPGADTDQWDLARFVNAASVVNGPNANFDNFQRNGNTYTFSIDLSQWTANYAPTWSYTFSVRLMNGAAVGFEGAKQVQIYSPTVSVASASLAPVRASQGQTGVPMLALTLSLDANWGTLLPLGPANFDLNRVRLTRTGSGTNADVSGAHVWNDVNGNGVLDAGDVLLGSVSNLGGVGFPTWVGQAGTPMAAIGSSAPLHLILAYDIAPSAVVGDTVGVQVASGTDLALPGSFAGVNGLPATSGNVLITGASVLTVTDNPGVAPGSAVRGQPNVPIDLLHLASNGPVMVVTQISVSLAGTGTPSDIAAATLHVDNGDGIYKPTQDPQLGSPQSFPVSGSAIFTGLNFQVDSVGRDVWIVYDVSANAGIGDRVGSNLAHNSTVVVTYGTVYDGTFPLTSDLVTVSGPTLTVTPRSLAPAQARQGRTNLPMLQLSLTVDFGSSTVSGFRIDKTGTSILDSDVPLAKVWLDNGDSLFDTGDVLLGSQGFVGGTTVIGGLILVVTPTQSRVVFITYDISASATTGVTVGARLRNAAYVSVDTATTVDPDSFPMASALTQITAPGSGAYLTIGSVDMAAWTPTVYAGQRNVPLEKLYLTVDANSGTVIGMHVDKLGTSLYDADVVALKLYRDADGNGNFSTADQILGSTTFVGGIAIFGALNIVVPMNQPVMLFLVIDLSKTASVGKTVGLQLGNHVYVVGNATTTIDPNSFPIRSSTVTIAAGTLSGVVRDANGNPIANATVLLPQLNRTTTTGANGAYSFDDVPMGNYYIIARAPGYLDGNVSANFTPSAPSQIVNFDLTPVPTGLSPGAFVAIAVGGGLAAIALLGLLLLFLARRRSKCPVCGKPKARDPPVCPECAAKGLLPLGAVPPPQPPAQPPMPPTPPSPPGDDL